MTGPSDDLDRLIALLGDGNAPMEARLDAATRLNDLGDPRAVPALAATLDLWGEEPEEEAVDVFHDLRWEATLALGRLRDVRAIDALVRRLLDPDETDELARDAAGSLGQIGSPAAAPTLIQVMRSLDPGNRWEASLDALIKIGGAEAYAAIAEVQSFRSRHLPATIWNSDSEQATRQRIDAMRRD